MKKLCNYNQHIFTKTKKFQIMQSFNPALKGLFVAEKGWEDYEKNVLYDPLTVIILGEHDFIKLTI